VADEVAYGAYNLGLRGKELSERIEESLRAVGLDAKLVSHKSPFHLSGGVKRLVAIASVLAMNPCFLILDEPTANLDERAKRTLLDCLTHLRHERRMGLLIASHYLEEVLPRASRLLVLDAGRLVFDGTPQEVLLRPRVFAGLGADTLPLPRLMLALRDRGLDVRSDVYRVGEAVQEIQRALQKRSMREC
jgi:energy-coupling factor transport system ATP-binding protein